MSKAKEGSATQQEQLSEQDKVEETNGEGHSEMVTPTSSPSSDGLRRRNVQDRNSSPQQESRTANRPVRNNENNITSLLVFWALIFVIVMLALRRLMYM